MKNEIIKVDGMKCHHCEASVENEIKQLAGVANVKANHVEGNVNVEYDDNILQLSSIYDAVENSGYEVVL